MRIAPLRLPRPMDRAVFGSPSSPPQHHAQASVSRSGAASRRPRNTHQEPLQAAPSVERPETCLNVGIGADTPQYALHVKRTDGTAKIVAEEASATTVSRSFGNFFS